MKKPYFGQVMKTIKVIEKRSNHRYQYTAEISYGSDDGDVGKGFIQNISLGGVRISAERSIPVGSDVLVTMPYPKSKRYVSLRGRVERLTQDGFAVSFNRKKMDFGPGGGWNSNSGWGL
jgi:hypothetical protein